MNLEEPREHYRIDWDPEESESSEILTSWSLNLQDMDGNNVAINFDVTGDNSLVIIGMYLWKFTMTEILSKPPLIIVERP